VAVIDRIYMQRTVAVVSEDSIAVRPSRVQWIAPAIQALIALAAVWLLVTFLNSMPLWLLTILLIVAILLGPAAVLGLVYNLVGSEFLIERAKQSVRWQQGFLGLGIGTAELVPFWRIGHVEVVSDFDEVLTSGEEQDFVQFDVRLVKDNGRVLDIGTIVSPRPLAAEGMERANRLVRYIGEMTGCEVRPLESPALVESETPPELVRPAFRRRRRVVRRERGGGIR
jgi:membrane protein YdbS with pleckstrin-like domain